VTRIAILVALTALMGATACGSDDASPAQVVAQWIAAVSDGDDEAAARLFGPSATVVQGGVALTLWGEADALEWVGALPCAAEIVESETVGNRVTARIALSDRGSTPCDGPGEQIVVEFVVADGKIIRLSQEGAPTGGAVLE